MPKSIRSRRPWLRQVFADGGYAGPGQKDAMSRFGDRSIEIVRRLDGATGFEAPPRRWVVARTFAWACSNRRPAGDVERAAETVRALFRIA